MQTLRLSYTDWDGNKQSAWLIGDTTTGYTFLTFNASASNDATLSPETCTTNGSCGVVESIKYIGADGQQYSAKVQPYQPPTGTPTVSTAVEGSPATLKANNFAPGGAVAPITYLWSFKASFCNALSCVPSPPLLATRSPIPGRLADRFRSIVTATDAIGAQATTTLHVPVSSLPPTLTFAPTCVTGLLDTCNVWRGSIGNPIALRGTVGHVGSEDRLKILVNWGDGNTQTADVARGSQPVFFGGPMTLIQSPTELKYSMLAPHVYANPGVYSGTVTVVNLIGLAGDGGTIVRPFTMNVLGSVGPVANPTQSPAANANGWTPSRNVTVNWNWTDAGSGIDSLLRDEQQQWQRTWHPHPHRLLCRSAGQSWQRQLHVEIDPFAPSIVGARSPAPNGFGWNNSTVTVNFTCADGGLSGVATNTLAGATLSSEGANQAVTNTGSCVDNAGNVSTPITVGLINIDLTKPTISAATITQPNGNGWYNSEVTVRFTCADALSGSARSRARRINP